MRTFPWWLVWSLQSITLLLGLLIVLYPLSAVESTLVHDPKSGDYLRLIRSHHFNLPFHTAWGLEGLRRLPLAVRLLGFGLLLFLTFLGRTGQQPWPRQPGRRAHAWLVAILLSLAFLVALFLFRALRFDIRAMSSFGDVPALVQQIHRGGFVFAAEVLTMHLYNGVAGLIRSLSGAPNGLAAGQWTSYLCGGGFVLANLLYVRALHLHRLESLLLFAGVTLSGYLAHFFGYVETTPLVLMLLPFFFWASARFVHATSPRGRWLALAAAFATLGLSCMAHSGGVILIPACLALLAGQGWSERRGVSGSLRGLFDPRSLGLFVLLALLPFVIVVILPFYTRGNYGNVMGGADRFRFVPWDFEAARVLSQYVYYGMLSRLHFYDLVSAFLIAAPLAIPQLAAGGFLLASRRVVLDRREAWLLCVLFLAAGSGTFMTLIWDFDFGIWGDWNIASCYLMPLNLFSWNFFISVARACDEPGGLFVGVGLPMLLAQSLLGLGIALQFYA